MSGTSSSLPLQTSNNETRGTRATHESNTSHGVQRSSSRNLLPRAPRAYQLCFDALAFCLSFVGYYWLRHHSGLFVTVTQGFNPASAEEWLVGGAVVTALYLYWTLVFWVAGLYENWYVRSPFDEIFTMVRVTFVGSCILGISVFLDDTSAFSQNSRLLVLLYWAQLLVCVCAGRILARTVQRRLRSSGKIQIPVVLVGCAKKLHELWNDVQRSPTFGYKPLGVVLRDATEEQQWAIIARNENITLPTLGLFPDVAGILTTLKPEEALMSIDVPNHDETLRIAEECEERHIKMQIVPDLYEIFSGQARASRTYGMPFIEVRQQLLKPWEEVLKRLLDVAFSAAALLASFPICCVVAAAVVLESPGGVFYSQVRVGRYGRTFTIYKFRSMRNDAEKDGPQWSVKNDARVTNVGKFIRKTHLDEIPQFWNILRGDMSVVGPRPERPFFVEKYSTMIPHFSRRLKVHPGLTGWSQVNTDHLEETLEVITKRLHCDFFYIENMSFKLDIEIILRTAVIVLKGGDGTS
jgi:exopolysaccharide biosynthesis polyprenyl glycosylphosphotransferase